jgi:hypothetical protein
MALWPCHDRRTSISGGGGYKRKEPGGLIIHDATNKVSSVYLMAGPLVEADVARVEVHFMSISSRGTGVVTVAAVIIN